MCWSRTSSTETETRKQTMSSSASWHYNSLAFNEASSVNQLQTEMQLASTTKPIIAARRRRGNVMPSDRYRYNIRYSAFLAFESNETYYRQLCKWFISVILKCKVMLMKFWLINSHKYTMPRTIYCRNDHMEKFGNNRLISKCKTVFCISPGMGTNRLWLHTIENLGLCGSCCNRCKSNLKSGLVAGAPSP